MATCGLSQVWRAELLSIELDPGATLFRTVLDSGETWCDRCVVVLIVRFYQGSDGADRQRELKESKVIGRRQMTVIFQSLDKRIVKLLIGFGLIESAGRNSV